MQFGRLIEDRVFPLVPECRNRICDSFIETAVQCAEFICRNDCVLLYGQISDRLANSP